MRHPRRSCLDDAAELAKPSLQQERHLLRQADRGLLRVCERRQPVALENPGAVSADGRQKPGWTGANGADGLAPVLHAASQVIIGCLRGDPRHPATGSASYTFTSSCFPVESRVLAFSICSGVPRAMTRNLPALTWASSFSAWF